MEKQDLERFETRLKEELATLDAELSRIGRRNPDNPGDWEPKPPEGTGTLDADRNDAADRIEGYEENSAILKELEIRYHNVKRALEKIADGTYGFCELSGEPIEMDRLEANPAARTSKANMNRESELPYETQ
jgi:DnaK suppressor protein